MQLQNCLIWRTSKPLSLYNIDTFKFSDYSGPEVDIWSCGVILYIMLVGDYPFNGEDMRDVVSAIKRGRFAIPHMVSLEAKDLLLKMLVINPVERITLQRIK
jgi:serine/threonine protein kinase